MQLDIPRVYKASKLALTNNILTTDFRVIILNEPEDVSVVYSKATMTVIRFDSHVLPDPNLKLAAEPFPYVLTVLPADLEYVRNAGIRLPFTINSSMCNQKPQESTTMNVELNQQDSKIVQMVTLNAQYLGRIIAVSCNISIPIPASSINQPIPYLNFIAINLSKLAEKQHAKTTRNLIASAVQSLAELTHSVIHSYAKVPSEFDLSVVNDCLTCCRIYNPQVVMEVVSPVQPSVAAKFAMFSEVLRHGQMVATILAKLLHPNNIILGGEKL